MNYLGLCFERNSLTSILNELDWSLFRMKQFDIYLILQMSWKVSVKGEMLDYKNSILYSTALNSSSNKIAHFERFQIKTIRAVEHSRHVFKNSVKSIFTEPS